MEHRGTRLMRKSFTPGTWDELPWWRKTVAYLFLYRVAAIPIVALAAIGVYLIR